MTDDDNIIPFTQRPLPTNDPVFQAAVIILDWAGQMKKEGRCPAAVTEALTVLFEGWPIESK